VKIITSRFFICNILLFFLIQPVSLQGKELKAVYAQGYLPYSWAGDNGKAKGLEIDFVETVMTDKLSIDVTHHVYPWARAQALVEEGSADIFVTIPNKKRRSYTQVTDTPLFKSNFLMHTGASNPKKNRLLNISSLQDLISQKDIIHGHIVGGGWHSVNLKNAKLLQVAPSSLQILQLLDRNRIDVYIEQTPLIRYQIQKLGFEGRITEIPHVIEETQWHICISKKSSFVDIMPRLNSLLKEMQKNGSLLKLQEEIFSRYR